MVRNGDRRVVLGRISGVFGVRGWVRVFSYTEPREGILEHDSWRIGREGDWLEFRLVEGRRHGKSVIARLEGVADRDHARGLIGAEIAVDRRQLPDAVEGEYYWADLIGLKVVNADGRDLGVVDHLLETGANDVLVIRGDREYLVPFVRDRVIKAVDLEQGVIRVSWDPDY